MRKKSRFREIRSSYDDFGIFLHDIRNVGRFVVNCIGASNVPYILCICCNLQLDCTRLCHGREITST